MEDKDKFIEEALKEAKKAYKQLEIPIGAVIVKNGKIIAKGHNQKEKKADTTMHAEMIAIKKASKKLGAWRLNGCEMYVTLEPCPMCAGAIVNARLDKIYIGTMDEKNGACGSVTDVLEDYKQNYKVEKEVGIHKEECERMLKEFFKELRQKKINKGDK